MLDKFAVARALREIGSLLELEGENPFKVRAYETGARALEGLSEDLSLLVRENRLTEIPGIGEALSLKIASLHTTERSDTLDKLRARHPPGILELLLVQDLGPKKIALLSTALGIDSLESLLAACREGKVAGVKGFGEKTQEKILSSILKLKSKRALGRVLLSTAKELAEPLVLHLLATGKADRLELAGSARRGKETVGDLDLVCSSKDPLALSAALAGYQGTREVLGQGETKTSVRLEGGLQVDLRVVPDEDFATLLHHLTGSKAHHLKLRALARDRGFTLSEWGLFRVNGQGGDLEKGEKIPVPSEAALYRALSLAYVPPELREDTGEIEAAKDGTLPSDLVKKEDLQGMVHCHTTWSDGRASVEEMARAALALGYRYLTITDHSRSATYAHGLSLDQLRRQFEEIDRVREKVKIVLLKGTEADILEDGSLDWPDEVIEELDLVIASVHSRMRMGEDEMTRRLKRAMSLPFFKIWGHGVGRLLLERDPYPCRVTEVLDALAASKGAVEVNGDPRRLDLEPRHLRAARERGIPIVLSSDAHSPQALRYLDFAVTTARRGFARRGEVLNTRDAIAFASAVRPLPSL